MLLKRCVYDHHQLYDRLDVDGSGGIGMAEMRDGLPKIVPDMNFLVEGECR